MFVHTYVDVCSCIQIYCLLCVVSQYQEMREVRGDADGLANFRLEHQVCNIRCESFRLSAVEFCSITYPPLPICQLQTSTTHNIHQHQRNTVRMPMKSTMTTIVPACGTMTMSIATNESSGHAEKSSPLPAAILIIDNTLCCSSPFHQSYYAGYSTELEWFSYNVNESFNITNRVPYNRTFSKRLVPENCKRVSDRQYFHKKQYLFVFFQK